ncbi:MAG TPA: hypothetical protein VF702_07250 [Allosphingosinicella sp.]|jgi:hypothetical protein
MFAVLAFAAAWGMGSPPPAEPIGDHANGFRDVSRQWLQRRGLLAGVPAYDPENETPAAFAVELETHCGLERGAGLQPLDGGEFAVRPRASADRVTIEPFLCLIYAFTASNAMDHGLRLGFLSEPPPASGRD